MAQHDQTQTADRNRTALDWLNFFLADVKDGIGPFLAIFLTSSQHWDPAARGLLSPSEAWRRFWRAVPRVRLWTHRLETHLDRGERGRGGCGLDCDGGLSRILAGGVCARFERDRRRDLSARRDRHQPRHRGPQRIYEPGWAQRSRNHAGTW